MSKERRLTPRIEFHHDILIRGSRDPSKIRNFSTGGAFIQTTRALQFKRGHEIDVVTTLPLERKAISVKARVAHVEKEGIGVEFVDVFGREAAAIDSTFEVFKATVPLLYER
jgi:c-di-GMP-binding flagellar brake protein YcgR